MAGRFQPVPAMEDAGDVTVSEAIFPGRDAFSELMRAKPEMSLKKKSSFKPESAANDLLDPFRDGLYTYLEDPEFHKSRRRVVEYNEDWVIVVDAYPKSFIHFLVMPRDLSKASLNPRVALSDPKHVEFLDAAREGASFAVKAAASELQRQLGMWSATERTRNEAMDADNPPEELPEGRDWTKDIKVGVHAHPSMNHIHIHVLSRDMTGDYMNKRPHYNSFNTDFFIPLDAFPLDENDRRWDTRYQNENLKADYKCWRCEKVFGNKFKQLQAHLKLEFEAWKAE